MYIHMYIYRERLTKKLPMFDIVLNRVHQIGILNTVLILYTNCIAPAIDPFLGPPADGL